MPCSKSLLIAVLTVFMPIMLFSQNPKAAKWKKHIAYLKARYNYLPTKKLDTITNYLDSSVIGAQCYRFITNADSTKCVAFFLTEMDSPSYTIIKREYGGTYHDYTWDDKKDNQIEIFAYTVSGMYYQGKWYYEVGPYIRFYAEDIEDARNIFLMRTLTENQYFRRNRPEENRKFWGRNEFAKNTYPYKDNCPNTPEVVCKATLSNKSRDVHNKNKSIEAVAVRMSIHLWDSLHQVSPVKYHSRLGNPLSLYNADRNIVLLPILYNDQKDTANLIYFVMKVSPEGMSVNTWKKFPEKSINREKGYEAREIIYDIRTFMHNWGWGTVNMISDEHFWNDNFKREDLGDVSL